MGGEEKRRTEEEGGDGLLVLCCAGKRDVVVNVAPAVHGYGSKTNATIKSSGMQQISSAIKGRRGVRECPAGRGRGDNKKKRGWGVLLSMVSSPRGDTLVDLR